MFGAPWWLLGMLAGAAPIIIHLLNRQRFKRVTWAAMEWLLRALERNRRRMRMENLILLILRAAILVLLALALSKPIIEAGSALNLIEGSRVCRIFVLDASYSMGVEIGGRPAFDVAKKAVGDLLAARRSGDVASLVVSGTDSAEIIPEPTPDAARIGEQLDAAELSHREVNLAAVLTRVAATAQRLPHPRVEVYVFTDLQRLSWLTEGAIRDKGLADALKKARDKAAFFVVDCVGREVPNSCVARVSVSADDSDEQQGLVPLALPSTVRATVENFSDAPRDEVAVRMLVDGQVEGRKVVKLDPRTPETVRFAGVVFREPGSHVVRVEADADGLRLDDARDLVIDLQKEIRVLCVNGQRSADLASNETYFLERALAPSQFEFGGASTPFTVETIGDSDFLAANLGGYRMVVLANVFQVPAEKVAGLEAFVKSGGAVVIFLGERVESSAYNRLLWRDGQGLLPARIMERKSFPAEPVPGQGISEFSRFDVRSSTHEVIRTLKEKSVDISAGARVREYFYLQANVADPAVRVLCCYDNPQTSPAIVEKSFGQGHVVLVSTSASPRWSTFPLIPGWLPFMQELASYMVKGFGGERNLTVGEPIRTVLFPGEFADPVEVAGPTHKSVKVSPAPEGDAYRLDYADTGRAGVYAVDFGGSKGKAAYAVTLDTRESDLARTSPRELDAVLGDNPIRFVSSVNELHSAAEKVQTGSSLWKAFVLTVLGMAVLESILATLFGRRRGVIGKKTSSKVA
jgi:hypothetical protein